jgi:hypothetical protein
LPKPAGRRHRFAYETICNRRSRACHGAGLARLGSLCQEFPVKHAWNVVEYRSVTLAGGVCLVPARSLRFMDVLPPLLRPQFMDAKSETTPDHQHYLNRLEFRNYRKFAAESKLVVDAAPEQNPSVPAASAPATPPASAPGLR